MNILHTVECPTCYAKVGQRCRKQQVLTHVYATWQHPKREEAARAAGRDAEIWAGLGDKEGGAA